jgi:hypothetical protein
VSALEKSPKPRTARELQQFTGFVHYYRKLIDDYAKIAIPLYNGKKENYGNDVRNGKTQHARWTRNGEETFDTLITKLKKQISLLQHKQEDLLDIVTEASSQAIASTVS